MENPKINTLIDIRQSMQWGKYLEYLGWKKHSIGEFKNIFSQRIGPLTIAKMQRPVGLNSYDLEALDNLAQDSKLSFVKLEPSQEQNIDELKQAQYIASHTPLCPPSTIFINLENNIGELHTNLSHSVKYSITRSVREGGRVDFYTNPSVDVLTQVYPAMRDTAIKQKFFVPSFDDLKTKLDLWGTECHIAVVKNVDGVIQGTKLFLGFNKNVWFMHGGTTMEGRKTKFGYLLLWESILHLKELGYSFLDLEGKDDKRFPSFTKSWGGFSHFKERFGGIQIQYASPVVKNYSPVLKLFSNIFKSASPL